MTGKKGGLPAVITDDLQGSRFFTLGAMLLVGKKGRDFFLILLSW